MGGATVDESTHERDSETGLPRSGEACLVVIHGVELGRRYPLAGQMRIGRDAGNQIVLDSRDVSRCHAELRQMRDRWFVNDLLSTNGTEVNDRRIAGETILNNGDFINVGGVIFKFIGGGNLESQFHEEIYRLTVFDGLTRLHNKRYLLDFLEREIARSSRHGRPLAVAMLDLDHFKGVNDTHGHLAGDHLLHAVATLIRNNVRREELVARWGGEEFAFVMPEADLSVARAACEKLRDMIDREIFVVGGELRHVTISAGIAPFERGISRDELLLQADEQLYRAKRGGRNRVVAAGDLV
jgi:two-component system, cell cycle response regulator